MAFAASADPRRMDGRPLADAGLSRVDCLAIAYLALPVALFLFTWFKPWFGIPLGIAALSGLVALFPLPAGRLPGSTVAIVAILALAWAALSGAGHYFYAGQALNWPIRDAVLRDLVLRGPAEPYRSEGGVTTILRAPIAYYMVPALLAKVAGVARAFDLLYLWTALGTLLFLLQMAEAAAGWKSLLLVLAVVMLSGGMDLLGPNDMYLDPATQKLSPIFLYQSTYNANLLIGFPNHGVPGWLATALIYRCGSDARFVKIAAWLGALTLLWAPLVSIGLLPFFLALAGRQFAGGRWKDLLSPWNLLAAPLVSAATALYLVLGAGTITTTGVAGGEALPAPFAAFLPVYAAFMVLEFGALSIALVLGCREAIRPLYFAIAVLWLLALPWFHFGPNNDLVTRGSIPALLVILFTVIDGWARPVRLGGRAIFVTVILLIGAVLPVARMVQAASGPAWPPDLQHSLYEITAGGSPNYLANLPRNSLLGRVLAAP